MSTWWLAGTVRGCAESQCLRALWFSDRGGGGGFLLCFLGFVQYLIHFIVLPRPIEFDQVEVAVVLNRGSPDAVGIFGIPSRLIDGRRHLG